MIAVIGLGNPGSEYEKTRHNVGFMALDFLREQFGVEEFHEKKSLLGEMSEGSINGSKILLFKPTTFMNLSGNAVQALIGFYKLDPKQCIVIYDDIDLAVGTLRIRPSGSAGTHNGMRSICTTIGNDFPRIRIGIDGRTPEQKLNQDLADYVLGAFNKQERALIEEQISKIPEELKKLVKENV